MEILWPLRDVVLYIIYILSLSHCSFFIRTVYNNSNNTIIWLSRVHQKIELVFLTEFYSDPARCRVLYSLNIVSIPFRRTLLLFPFFHWLHNGFVDLYVPQLVGRFQFGVRPFRARALHLAVYCEQKEQQQHQIKVDIKRRALHASSNRPKRGDASSCCRTTSNGNNIIIVDYK